jgi:hypothetical protein
MSGHCACISKSVTLRAEDRAGTRAGLDSRARAACGAQEDCEPYREHPEHMLAGTSVVRCMCVEDQGWGKEG